MKLNDNSLKQIYSLSLNELKEELLKLNLKPFISKQIYSWIYQKRIFDFDKFSNISKSNQSILKENFDNNLLTINEYQSNSDGSIKFKLLTTINLIINCMIIKFENGFLIKINPFGINDKKEIINLSTNELVLQTLLVQQFLDQHKLGKITNVIVKGSQDSLLNMEAVSNFINIINDENGLNIGKRKIVVWTSGVDVDLIKWGQLQNQIELIISLNASNSQVYKKLMLNKTNQNWSFIKLIEQIKTYTEMTNNRVVLEYLLIDKINDNLDYANELVELLKNILCYVLLIPYNLNHKTSDNLEEFFNILSINKIRISKRVRKSNDLDISFTQLKIKE
ncbi:23S rRNA (adenine(2503)-C(2))-methyltransferase RlmN [Ureaplasma urealyticum]|uniref:23S rRNA (Adenine(2503)-C(2))-methyltransferase RlmN n=3 Tax=Ureaplasma urealyticum TaxID=2130 RepID=A0AAP9D7A0_UREUR|nr:23S rRNA (adenine(2503)-C(2))-methyltransferase RlmN [Ureaplasma urealyticum]EDX53886.1 conserved hypothetical protein [Ureaplasma urealyticum serovar 9 str. ATCC 33175]ACI59929.1 conserved hypothetical protein [Ureaplasma urealyticum serovar 10 str. ATCC 33699]EDT49814.1 conserved hypothetical protein [Ureaplasma urealyticum serovar 13 str. ATCC 33698]EDU06538.1 conserved hypothetical protein [Ureaplasma urealyticum serovar 5 str. ATCC 27817]EDU56827.1 conserved hypothetical protein [Ureap